MKKLLVLATLLAFGVFVVPVRAETVETCETNTSNYASGTVCGSFTVKDHTEYKVTEFSADTAAGDNQMIKLALAIVGAALTATVLYKLTYKSYILG